jgi:tetratricopeptide (TPR) repeat protein
VAIDPDFATAFYRRGLINKKLRKYEEALSDLSEAAYLDHNNPEIYSSKGLL